MAKLNDLIRSQLYKILFWQLLMIIGLAVIFALLTGIKSGCSVLFGALSYWFPTFMFMWRVSAHAGARAATRFMVAFFSGEVVKLFLSGVLFVLAVKYLSLDMMYGVLGLVGAIVAFWVASVASLMSGGRA